MRYASGHEGGRRVEWGYCAQADFAGRMTVCGECVLLLLSDVGVCWFTFATHQYDAPATMALPAGQAHQVAAWCAESSAASAGMRGKVVCMGGTTAGMHLGLS